MRARGSKLTDLFFALQMEERSFFENFITYPILLLVDGCTGTPIMEHGSVDHPSNKCDPIDRGDFLLEIEKYLVILNKKRPGTIASGTTSAP